MCVIIECVCAEYMYFIIIGFIDESIYAKFWDKAMIITPDFVFVSVH